MDDGLLGAFQRLEGAGDQILSRLGQYLDGDVVGNMAALDQLANEVEIGLRSGGEAHLDFLEADLHQCLEETHLLRGIHRFDQRLVAVAQIGAQPDRRLGDGLRRPGAIGDVDGREGTVFIRWILEHGHGVSPGEARAKQVICRCGHRFMVQSYCLVRAHCNTSKKIGDLFRLFGLLSVLFLLKGKSSCSIARSACGHLSQRSRRGGRAIIRSTPQHRFGRLRTWR